MFDCALPGCGPVFGADFSKKFEFEQTVSRSKARDQTALKKPRRRRRLQAIRAWKKRKFSHVHLSDAPIYVLVAIRKLSTLDHTVCSSTTAVASSSSASTFLRQSSSLLLLLSLSLSLAEILSLPLSHLWSAPQLELRSRSPPCPTRLRSGPTGCSALCGRPTSSAGGSTNRCRRGTPLKKKKKKKKKEQ